MVQSGVSFAQDNRRKITYKADKRFNLSKKEMMEKAKADREKAKSTIKYEDFIKKAQKVQNLKIPLLVGLIQKNKRQLAYLRAGDKRAVEYMFRMADAFVQLEQIYKYKFGEVTEKITTATGDNRKKLLQKKMLYMQRQKKYLENALKLLNAITANTAYQNWHRMDEVLFKLGDIARELGYQDIMQQKFRLLLSRYPTSNFVPNVYLAFAEFYFKKGRTGLSKATKYYKKVVTSNAKGTGIYYYARRMLGWCYFNLQQYPVAQSHFLFVAQKAKRASLRTQARNEVVMAYAYQGNIRLAYDFFTHQLGKEYTRPLYIKLAQEYFAQGNMASMIWIYEDLMRRFPKDINRCEWMRQVYLGYKLDQRVEKMATALETLVNTMGAIEKQFGNTKMQYRVCRDFAKAALFDQAKRWFSLVEKGKANKLDERKTLMFNAAKLYNRFLNYFPNDDDAYEMRGDYAYLLYRLAELYEEETNGKNPIELRNRFRFAAEEYTKLLKWNKKPKKMDMKKFTDQRVQIGNDTVACWMKVLAVDFEKTEKDRNKRAQDYKRRRNCLNAKKKTEDAGRRFTRKCPVFEKNMAIPPQLKNVIEVFDLYVKYVQGGKFLPTIKYNRAMIYYIYRHFSKAIPLFKDTVFTSYETNPVMSYQAVNFMMIAYDAEDRFEDMVDSITELLKPRFNKMFNTDGKSRTLRKQLVRAKLENLENEVAKRGTEGRYNDAGNLLMEMARDYESSSPPTKIINYYNSAYIAYDKAGQVGMAIRALKTMQWKYAKTHKKEKQIVNSNLIIGQLFERIAMFDLAAASYEQFFKDYPRDPDAVKAARRAISLLWWSGKVKQAENKNRDFITRLHRMGANKFKGDMASMFFMLHSFYEGKKDEKVKAYLDFYIQRMAVTGTNDLLLRAYSRIGKYFWDRSCPVKPKYGVCMKIVYVTKKSTTDTWKEAKVVFLTRKRGLLKLSVQYFGNAVKVYNKWKGTKTTLGSLDKLDKTRRIEAALNAAAQAKFHLAEANYEEIISAEVPMLKANNTKEINKSLAGIKKWMGKQTALMTKVKKLYEEVGRINLGRNKPNEWYVPAAGRFGAIYKNFHTKVANIKFGKAIENNITVRLQFRDTFSNATEKFMEFAKTGFDACVKAAQKTGRYDEWFEFCENELAAIKRSVSPLSDEVWAKPDYKQPAMSGATIMTNPVR
ncbi:hypothetical protein KKF84_20900 [Myxococcota bacterium]|nr:hypothetical protein [Myxococcota bacterium]